MQHKEINKIGIYGAGGHAKVIIDILEANELAIDYVVDDKSQQSEFMGYPLVRDIKNYDLMIIAIGSNAIRERIVSRIKVNQYICAIHPSAIISPKAIIGDGTVVMQGSIIQTGSRIGRHCIINTGASVDHDCEIEDFVHIAPHATLAGGVIVGKSSWIGIGACIKQGIKIGKNVIIGAGAVVINDVPDGVVMAGVPAKLIRCRDEENSLSWKCFLFSNLTNILF